MKRYFSLLSALCVVYIIIASGCAGNGGNGGATGATATVPPVTPPPAPLIILTNSVKFGTRGMGLCQGRGICKAKKNGEVENGIPVDFSLNEEKTILTFKFDLKILQRVDPTHVKDFAIANPAGGFNLKTDFAFDEEFDFSVDPEFALLAAKPGSKIKSGVLIPLTINGTVVTAQYSITP